MFLRVPARDWPAVKRGIKTEFRAGSGAKAVPQLFGVPAPVPAVAYAIRQGRHDARLMMLEALWQEPLGAISADSLAREGFGSLTEFREYWMQREHKRFTPTRQVFCYRLRPWRDGDIELTGAKLLEHLYGEFLRELA